VIAGVTCPNHESDWEGVTVIVDRTDVPRVVAVQYAQHASTVRYDWQLLRRRWDGHRQLEGLVGDLPDWSTRPLVFVAAGTHAAYPTPCGGPCRQVATASLGEDRHRGEFGWIGNYTATCGRSSCLQLLPTREHGAQPALWNDYDGPWGDRHCVFTYYCDSATPPKSPGHQGRYRHPTEYDGYVGSDWRFHEGAEPAAALGAPAGGA
jgi:hypothetical protein